MRLSISNIGWKEAQDGAVYALMQSHGFFGLEIAPTRIFPQNPYENISSAQKWAEDIREKYGFSVPSMQSIWYGRSERLFGSQEERTALLEYTKKAIDFASAIGCGNLVFGCPRNRAIPEMAKEQVAIDFFKTLGDYSAAKGTIIGMEANPPIYNTNYINTTQSALDLVARVNSPGFKLNLDVGTMVCNGETVDIIRDAVDMISHVHISEPGLKAIQKREFHNELAQCLRVEGYSRFVSIEMGIQEEIAVLKSALEYVEMVFGQG